MWRGITTDVSVHSRKPLSAFTRSIVPFATNAPEAHVWWLRTDRAFPSQPSVLSREELPRARRFRFKRHQTVYATTRTALRYVLAHYTGRWPEALRLGVGPCGKPYVVDPTAPRLSFNVSHAGAYAMIAVTNGSSVGIDIEQVQTTFEWSDVAAHAFAASESDWLRGMAPDRRCENFYRMWVMKEAVVKADGRGLSVPLRDVVIDGSHQLRWRRWWVQMAAPGGGLRRCYRGRERPVHDPLRVGRRVREDAMAVGPRASW